MKNSKLKIPKKTANIFLEAFFLPVKRPDSPVTSYNLIMTICHYREKRIYVVKLGVINDPILAFYSGYKPLSNINLFSTYFKLKSKTSYSKAFKRS